MVTDVVDDVGRLASGPGAGVPAPPAGPALPPGMAPGSPPVGSPPPGSHSYGSPPPGSQPVGSRLVGSRPSGSRPFGSGPLGSRGAGSGPSGAAGPEDPTLAATVVTTSVIGVVRLIAGALAVPTLLTGPVTVRPVVGVALPLLAALALVRYPGRLTATWSRRVLLLLADVGVGVAVLAVDGPGIPVLYQTLGTAALAAALWGVPGVLLGAAGGMAACLTVAATPSLGTSDRLPLAVVVSIPTGYALIALVAALVRHLHQEQVLLRQSLRAATWQSAQAAERTRLARELHDSLAKTLTGIGLCARAVRSGADRAELVDELAAEIAVAADEATAQARAMIAGLRETSSPDLAGAVRTTVGAWARSCPATVETDLQPVPEPPPEVRRELIAVLGEALSNIRRHADASRVRVELDAPAGRVRLVVRDDGRGLTLPASVDELAPTGRFGLLGMAERLREVGGTLTVRSAAGAGAVVIAEVPIRPGSAHDTA